MTTLFLYTFFVGFGLTIVSALLGAVDAGVDHGHGGDAGSLHPGGPGDAGSFDMGNGHGHGHSHGRGGQISTVSPINFQSLVAFLMGFGGVGYLSTRFGLLGYIVALPLAAAGGLGTAWLIYRFLRFLVKGERPMAPTTYEGLIGKLTVGIREGGTGEMVYSQHGTRMVTAARSTDGRAISRGEEVLVLRYEKGVAYVQPWKEIKEQEGL